MDGGLGEGTRTVRAWIGEGSVVDDISHPSITIILKSIAEDQPGMRSSDVHAVWTA